VQEDKGRGQGSGEVKIELSSARGVKRPAGKGIVGQTRGRRAGSGNWRPEQLNSTSYSNREKKGVSRRRKSGTFPRDVGASGRSSKEKKRTTNRKDNADPKVGERPRRALRLKKGPNPKREIP